MIHLDFVQFGNQHSRYTAILLSIVIHICDFKIVGMKTAPCEIQMALKQ